VIIIIVAIIVIALVAQGIRANRRTARLQDRFGPEYDRTVESSESRRLAEADLTAREDRRSSLDIRPLSHAARTRAIDAWSLVQAQFVDDPHSAVTSADSLIRSVMAERGYPVEDFDQRAADVSVDHPQVVENYREGHRLATANAHGVGEGTEELRQAMRHYRALFDELVEPDEPVGEREPVAPLS
jgi:hypothetical protein